MENFKYTLLKNSHSNFPGLDFSGTEDELRISPGRFPWRDTIITCGGLLVFTCLMGVTAGLLEDGKVWWGGTVIGGGIDALIILLVSIQFRLERKRGPTFILDKRRGRYCFPRVKAEGDQAELLETALVASNMEIDGARLHELQMLVRRRDAAPVAMLLMGCCGAGPLPGIQEKLAAALGLPAVRVRAAAL